MNGYNVASQQPVVTQLSPSAPIQQATETPTSGTENQVTVNAQAVPTQQVLPQTPGGGQQPLPQQMSSENASTPHHPIAEFLYQLTKMLTDDNREIIEWSNGKIKVHHPERLESEVLHKYFRHSKFASFQRQLNYFGFRKIAGKGKMSPCSYVNDAATSDIRSLLLIKRKTNGSAARKAAMAQRGMAAAAAAAVPPGVGFLTPGISGLPAGGVTALGVGADLINKAWTGQAQALGAMGIHPSLLIPEMQQQAVALQQQALQSAAASAAATVAANAAANAAAANAATAAAAAKTKPLGENLFFPSDNALAALTHTQAGQKRQINELAAKAGVPTSLDQFNSLGAIAQVQRNSALNLAALGVAAQPAAAAAATAALAAAMPTAAMPASAMQAMATMPATAAITNMTGTMPATAAANATNGQGNNLFESSNNLSALVGNDQSNVKAPQAAPGASASTAPGRLSSSNLLTRLPSSGTIFPDSLSTVSLTGLLGPGVSSNRISSMLSLSNLLSRDPSMVDLVPGAASNQLGAPGAAAPFAGLPLGSIPLVPLTANHSAPPVAPIGAPPGPATAAVQAAVQSPATAPAVGGVSAPSPALQHIIQQASAVSAAPSAQPPATSAPGAPVGGFDPTPIQDM